MANAWKIARKSNAQLPLIIVIALAVVLVLLGKAQSGLFDKARAHITDWMAPMLREARAPIQTVDRWVGSITEVFTVYQQNLALKEENARLRQWRNVAIVLQGRVGRYQTLLHAVPDPKLNAVLAQVIGRASRPFLQTMILDAGRDNHALPGEAVVDARGMIGRIYLAGQRTSWVILLTDLNSRIPVTIAPGNIQAIMTGDNTPNPVLDMVLHTVTLHAGDQVVSSGDGGLLPPGLPVGTVVQDSAGNWRVALLSDAAGAQDVEILNFAKQPEVPPASAQLPAEAAGLKPSPPPPPPAQPPATPKPVPPAADAAKKTKPLAVAAPPPQADAADAEDVGR